MTFYLKNSAVRFSDHSINWFKSYFSNCSFQENIDDKCSCIAKIDCEVYAPRIYLTTSIRISETKWIPKKF